jgi:exodeoxyribonuclease VII small subunit
MVTPKDKPLTFEQSLAKLEGIVTRVEEGQVPLEESIDCYAEGITLLKQCRQILDQAEEKIQLLSQSQAGGLTVEGELADEDDGDAK